MGLMVHSLGELPLNAKRNYYVYLLDYGWHEPLGQALLSNFDTMAAEASKNNAVVIKGVVGSHFEDEVFSWHSINGRPGEEILPAILITTRHPDEFRRHGENWRKDHLLHADRLLLIPLKETCKSTTDVADLIAKIFGDIKSKQALADFEVAKTLEKGKRGALVDALILKPNYHGLGLDLNSIIDFFRGRK
jgi:hypothetical protein